MRDTTARAGTRMLVGSLVGIAIVVMLWASGWLSVPHGPPGEGTATSPMAIGPTGSLRGEDSARTEAEREHLPATEVTGPPRKPKAVVVDSELAVVRGRCVAAETGEPLAGCELFLARFSLSGNLAYDETSSPVWGRPLELDSMVSHGSAGSIFLGPQHEFRPRGKALPDLALDRHFMTADRLEEVRRAGKYYQRKPNAVTGTDGRFELTCAPSSMIQFTLEVASHLRCPRASSAWGLRLKVGTVLDFGDVPLHLGARVIGRVRDQHGEPIVGARLRLDGVPHALPDKNDSIRAETRRGGRFAFDLPVPPGTYSVKVRAPGARLLGPEQLTVGTRTVDATIRVKTRPSISGLAVDDAGRPQRRTVLLGIGADGKVYGAAITDDEGRFRLRQEAKVCPPVYLVTGHQFTEFQGPRLLVEWGERDLRLVERTARPVELIVENAVTHQPVTLDMYVTYTPIGPGGSEELKDTDHFLQLDGPHGGKLVLQHVRSGRHSFRVQLNGGDGMVPATVEADLAYDGPRRVTVALQPTVGLRVRVTRRDGSPAVGVPVHLARSGSWQGKFPEWHNHHGFLAHAESNAKGEAFLRGAAPGMKVDVYAAGRTVRGILVAERMPPVRVELK